jgi:hypothetical protein
MAEIARLYEPGGEEPLAIRALAAESRGVPLSVHRVAAEWARAGASRAAGASAGRAATERDELRAAEVDLSSDLLAVRTVEERGRLYRGDGYGVPAPAVCPFLGLATFDAAHAEYFRWPGRRRSSCHNPHAGCRCYLLGAGAAASANGLPSESRHTAHRSPGWIIVPPSSRTRLSVAARSATVK